jgi:glycosyltransferase involved in cell wall biosynthesis
MAAAPFVSVVTPFYNTAPYLAECIESVLAQTHQQFEYLLVNNKSTDGSREIAARYCSSDSRLRLIDNPVFVGQVENYNGALAHISPASKYVKMVQADDTIFPECISRMVELAAREPGVGLVSSYWLTGDQQEGWGVPKDVSYLPGWDACRKIVLGGSYLLASPTSVLYRADIVRARNPFFTLGRYHEDTEAACEILLESDFGFVHQVLSFLRADNVSITTSVLAFNSYDLDYLIILERYGPLVLTAEELARQRAVSHGNYKRFLGRALLRCQGPRFWRYHRIGLATIGWELRWRDIVLQAARELVRLACSPRSTVKQAVTDVRKRLERRLPSRPS